MLFYSAALPLSSRTLNLTHPMAASGPCTAGLAWLVLVHRYKGGALCQVAAGFRVGTVIAWRYVRETTRLLAAQALTLEQGLRRARRRQGWAFVIVDGTLIAWDRLKAASPAFIDRPASPTRRRTPRR